MDTYSPVVGIFTGGIWQIIGQLSAFGAFIFVILIVFSLVSWAIMFHKWRQFRRVDDESYIFLNYYRKAGKFGDLLPQAKALPQTPLSGIFLEGYEAIRELIGAAGGKNETEDKPLLLSPKDMEILEMSLERIRVEKVAGLEKKVIFLATTANASPFLGLLGTVVGIMDSFWSIGERGSASLAVVAPGIAEALLVTIIGLAAAIPAVIGYNWANNRLKRYNDESSNFVLEYLARIKRDLTA